MAATGLQAQVPLGCCYSEVKLVSLWGSAGGRGSEVAE